MPNGPNPLCGCETKCLTCRSECIVGHSPWPSQARGPSHPSSMGSDGSTRSIYVEHPIEANRYEIEDKKEKKMHTLNLQKNRIKISKPNMQWRDFGAHVSSMRYPSHPLVKKPCHRTSTWPQATLYACTFTSDELLPTLCTEWFAMRSARLAFLCKIGYNTMHLPSTDYLEQVD